MLDYAKVTQGTTIRFTLDMEYDYVTFCAMYIGSGVWLSTHERTKTTYSTASMMWVLASAEPGSIELATSWESVG